MAITKTQLLRLSLCKNWFWLSIREPESLSTSEGGKALATEGIAFETFAREKFPQGVLLKSFGEPAVAKTNELLSAGKSCLFQATAMCDDFLVKADVLQRNDGGKFDLFEVKASTEIKDEYLLDVAIQRAVFNDAGIEIENCFLVILDRVYRRDGELELNSAIQIDDVTAQSRALEGVEVRPLMAEAKRLLSLNEVPVTNVGDLTCSPKGANRCGCADVSYENLPDFSVFDIARLSRDDCSKLINRGIVTIDEIKPRSIKLSQQQAIQVVLTQKKLRKVYEDKLKSELDQIRYPIYFLDYETYNFALPRLDGFSPYQHYVFQYSLHVQDTPGAELRHLSLIHI